MGSKTIKLGLNNSDFTWLHIAGVAGLWMTLSELAKKYPSKSQRIGNLDWSLTTDSVCLKWKGQDFEVLDWLFKESFQIDNQGLLNLVGLKPYQMTIEAKLAIHNGITRTFLQHNKFIKSDGDTSISIQKGDRTIKIWYKKVQSYAHQDFAKHFCEKDGELKPGKIGVVSWLYPGLIVRHEAFRKQTIFEETIEGSLALLFAPLCCCYFSIPFPPKSKKTYYALVFSQIENIPIFAESCWKLGELSYKFFLSFGASDAALKLLSKQSLSENKDFICRCYVMVFGRTPWSSQQTTRIEMKEIEVPQKVVDIYQMYLQLCFFFAPSDKDSFDEDVSDENLNEYTSKPWNAPIRIVMADNLTRNKPWWYNLFDQLSEHNALFEYKKYQELMIVMTDRTQWDEKSELLFIRACHEALRKVYAKEFSRVGENEVARIDRINQQFITRLKQCHNSDKFRSFLADFFGKAGHVSILEKHLEELYPITRGITDWKVSRDLFLIALASYKKKEKTRINQETSQSDETLETDNRTS